MTHPSTQLWNEVVRIARLLHWSLDTILDLEHPIRRTVLTEAEAQAVASVGPALSRAR